MDKKNWHLKIKIFPSLLGVYMQQSKNRTPQYNRHKMTFFTIN